jgi:endonuclease/exonuclease/phosphatase family metal-dependent hydrolase
MIPPLLTAVLSVLCLAVARGRLARIEPAIELRRHDHRAVHRALCEQLQKTLDFAVAAELPQRWCRVLEQEHADSGSMRVSVSLVPRAGDGQLCATLLAGHAVLDAGATMFNASHVRCHRAVSAGARVSSVSAASLPLPTSVGASGLRIVSVDDRAVRTQHACADPAEWSLAAAWLDAAEQRLELELRLLPHATLVRESFAVRGVAQRNGSSTVPFAATFARHRLSQLPETPLRLTAWSAGASDAPRRRRNVPSEGTRAKVTLASYNLWNFDDGPEWPERVKMLAKIIGDAKPDMVAVQEVRLRLNRPDARSQLDDLVALLGADYAHFAYEPAMAHPQTQDEEGLGVISRYPIEHSATSLPAATSDLNERIALTALTRIGQLPLVFANIHLTYDEESQLEQMYTAISFTKSREPREGAARIMTGDFNFYVHSKPSPVEKLTTGQLSFVGHTGDYSDAWRAVSGPGDPELMTFSPVKGWSARPDRFYAETPRCKTVSFDLLGIRPNKGRYASDHAGIIGVFDCASQD